MKVGAALINSIICSILCCNTLLSQPIDRESLVDRHKVINDHVDSLSSLSVGNGKFAFTVDVTGLQSFPEAYEKGVPLGTQSEWGWHSFIDTGHFAFSETLKNYQFNGKNVSYSVQSKGTDRTKNAVEWFRQNPHRLQLGNIGLEIMKKDGTIATIEDIHQIHQTLDLWKGEIHSSFKVEGIQVEVFTYCHQQQDLISCKLTSPLLKEKRLKIRIRFPYPNGEFKDVGDNWKNSEKHLSYFNNEKQGGTIHRIIDSTQYWLKFLFTGNTIVDQKELNYFTIEPDISESFEMSCLFSSALSKLNLPTFEQTVTNSKKGWQQFWSTGGAVDFSGSKDPRAFELERRVVLSQYLTRIQCAGSYPPQETGLTYNSWYGKPHLEMHWWHAIHFELWGRSNYMEKSLSWYTKVEPKARAIAVRQNYLGVRWQKMTDPKGEESPSSVGSFLIWQQPHIIYFAEQAYREHPDQKTLDKYKHLVFETADFMASYAFMDTLKQRYILGKGLIPAQEKFKAEETFNPTYELVYWYWALKKAQEWRARVNLARNKKWDDVVMKLSPLPIQEYKYLFTESGTDSYTNTEYRMDHPSVLGAFGMLPETKILDKQIMHNTFDWVINNWTWKDTWGWDYPMVAMTATRLGLPEQAVDALLMPVQKNTYLNNGHNYQDERLTIYLPGNGGLLAAVAIMCAGYEGNNEVNPGIPKNGRWKVRWEGLRKMF